MPLTIYGTRPSGRTGRCESAKVSYNDRTRVEEESDRQRFEALCMQGQSKAHPENERRTPAGQGSRDDEKLERGSYTSRRRTGTKAEETWQTNGKHEGTEVLGQAVEAISITHYACEIQAEKCILAHPMTLATSS